MRHLSQHSDVRLSVRRAILRASLRRISKWRWIERRRLERKLRETDAEICARSKVAA